MHLPKESGFLDFVFQAFDDPWMTVLAIHWSQIDAEVLLVDRQPKQVMLHLFEELLKEAALLCVAPVHSMCGIQTVAHR
jgi:hypothetical protein